jgi:hypothetical protein
MKPTERRSIETAPEALRVGCSRVMRLHGSSDRPLRTCADLNAGPVGVAFIGKWSDGNEPAQTTGCGTAPRVDRESAQRAAIAAAEHTGGGSLSAMAEARRLTRAWVGFDQGQMQGEGQQQIGHDGGTCEGRSGPIPSIGLRPGQGISRGIRVSNPGGKVSQAPQDPVGRCHVEGPKPATLIGAADLNAQFLTGLRLAADTTPPSKAVCRESEPWNSA